jgi:hypothetical protein
MAPNEQARKNHDELFPGHVSTLTGTDPELIEIFDNFAFDEVLARWPTQRGWRSRNPFARSELSRISTFSISS